MARIRPTLHREPEADDPAAGTEPAESADSAEPATPTIDAPTTSQATVAERERAERQREREMRRHEGPRGMVPARERRRTRVERGSMRLIATGGVVGISVLLGAILVGQNVAGWITGLVCGVVSIILVAILWSSRTL